MVPLTYSAGPGNILVAVSGVRVGMTRSLPFIVGLDLTYFLLSVLVGVGVGNTLITYPFIAEALKYSGIAYIFYLGSRFFIVSTATKQSIGSRFRILDGVMVQLTNVKGMIMLIVMFTEFTSPTSGIVEHVLLMSTALTALNFSAHLLWVTMGSGIQKLLGNYPAFQQGYNCVFGSMLIAVSIWLLIRF